MSEQHLLLLGALLIGLILGVIAMLVFNKVRGGSVSPGTLKQEMEDYQGQVETHFEQTSQKFQQMAEQYQDLYQHLAVGATSLCRPENISQSLTDQSDPLSKSQLIEQSQAEGSGDAENNADVEPGVEKIDEGADGSDNKGADGSPKKEADDSDNKSAVKNDDLKKTERSIDDSKASTNQNDNKDVDPK